MDFLSLETRTSTAQPVKQTSPSPSLARKEKGRFTPQPTNRLAGGTIRGSSLRSQKRISESIFSRAPFRQIRPDRSRATGDKKTFCQRNSFRNSRGDHRHRGRATSNFISELRNVSSS